MINFDILTLNIPPWNHNFTLVFNRIGLDDRFDMGGIGKRRFPHREISGNEFSSLCERTTSETTQRLHNAFTHTHTRAPDIMLVISGRTRLCQKQKRMLACSVLPYTIRYNIIIFSDNKKKEKRNKINCDI